MKSIIRPLLMSSIFFLYACNAYPMKQSNSIAFTTDTIQINHPVFVSMPNANIGLGIVTNVFGTKYDVELYGMSKETNSFSSANYVPLPCPLYQCKASDITVLKHEEEFDTLCCNEIALFKDHETARFVKIIAVQMNKGKEVYKIAPINMVLQPIYSFKEKSAVETIMSITKGDNLLLKLPSLNA